MEQAQRRQAFEGPLVPHFASHLCATLWMKGGRPPHGGWPQEALWRAAGTMFVGHIQ